MEFHEKLQLLRKQKGLTQEALAEKLFVSRAAVSKWESGRGYPNIDSLKAIAALYGVTVDQLLSGDELLTLAEAERKEMGSRLRDLVFSLLDLGVGLLLFLPFFAQKAGDRVLAVSLLDLSGAAPYLRFGFFLAVLVLAGWGVLNLALLSWPNPLWLRWKRRVSLLVNAAGTFLFIISQQPYAASFLFLFLGIKALLALKKG